MPIKVAQKTMLLFTESTSKDDVNSNTWHCLKHVPKPVIQVILALPLLLALFSRYNNSTVNTVPLDISGKWYFSTINNVQMVFL